MLRFSLASPIAIVLALSAKVALGQAAPGAPSAAPPAPAPATIPPGRAAPSGSAIDRGSLLEPAPASRTGAAPPAAGAAAPVESRETDRSKDVSIGANPKEVYAEDWWVRSHPILEFHGYLRVRAELFHGFALGRLD